MMRLLRATQTKRRVAFFFSKVFRSALSVILLIIDFYRFALFDKYIWTTYSLTCKFWNPAICSSNSKINFQAFVKIHDLNSKILLGSIFFIT